MTHIFFNDDVLLFAKAEVSQVRVLQAVFEEFCNAYGLKVNFAKSKAMTSWCGWCFEG